MLENLSLKRLSTFVLIVLMMIAGIFAAGTYYLNIKVDEINTAWLSFKSQHAEKARLETSLRAKLGYGGMIHDFKNYILRKDFERLTRLQRSLGAAQSIVRQYLALSTTQAEKLVLEDIQQMLIKYQEGLELARSEIKKGKTAKQIDGLVRIDDSYALRGMRVLHEEIVTEYEYYKDKDQKPVLATAIRGMLGYGGMIHAFKNYVLRGDEKYLKKARESIKDAETLIASYYNLNPTLGERTALDDIQATLNEYRKKLDIVRNMVKKKLSPELVDKAVRVSDKHALRGLTTLDQDIILQIDKKSERLSERLVAINEDETQFTYMLVLLILTLAIYLYILFSRRIIEPVLELSAVMTEIAHGNTDVDFSYPDTSKTELGEMARSLKIFKENEGKRRLAEEEVSRLAMTDPLTGLANRNQFDKRYAEMTTLARRENRLIALLALDLDKFKPVNDKHGHAAGDAILKSVASNLLSACRETDLVARMGGDEFMIILYGPENIETIEEVAKRIIILLLTPLPFDSTFLTVGTSIGITVLEPNDSEPMDEVMRRADEALYKAKEAGRNTYRFDTDKDDNVNEEKVALIHRAEAD